MEKTMKFLSMAALALMGVVMTGCSSDSDELLSEPQQPENKDKVETLTTTVSFNDGVAATRALTEGGVKTFAVGDQIAVAYKNSQDEWVKAVSTALTADDITNGGKSAKFTVTVSNADKTKDVKYIYPASIADDYGFVDYKLLDVQDGSLTTLASSLDACQGIGAWNGENLPALALENQFTICKFKIKAGGSDITSSITQLTINDGYNTYTVTPTSSLNDIWVAIRSDEDGKCTYKIYAAKGKDLYTKTVSGKAFDKGKIYPINVTTTKVDGAISGQFTVNNSGKKVFFSQGNLQAVCTSADSYGNTQETWTWQFATNQWDYIGGRSQSDSETQTGNNYINGNGSVSTAGTVDLFGWSTSLTYYGIHNSNNENTYIDGTKPFNDWGNTMGSGWYTLDGGENSGEWHYLFMGRSASTVNGTDNARFVKAYLFGTTHGIILFPDTYIHPAGVAAPTGINNTNNNSWNYNQYSAQDWAKMEAAGCVFLPAAGQRTGTTLESVNVIGHYWSSSRKSYSGSYMLFFYDTRFGSTTFSFKSGKAVRLVRNL